MNVRWLQSENCNQISTPRYTLTTQDDEPETNDYLNLIKQKDEQISCLQVLLRDVRETCASGRREPPPSELVRLTTEADLLRQTKEALKQQIVSLQEEFARTCEDFDNQLSMLNEEVVMRDEENKRLVAMLQTIASKEEKGTQRETSLTRHLTETQRINYRPSPPNKRFRHCRVQGVNQTRRRQRIAWQWDVCRVQLRGRPDLGFSNALSDLSVSHMSLPVPQRQPSRLLQSVSREPSRPRQRREETWRDETWRDETLWFKNADLMSSGSLRDGRSLPLRGRYRERDMSRDRNRDREREELTRERRGMAQTSCSRASSVRAPSTEGVRRNALMFTAQDIRRWLD